MSKSTPGPWNFCDEVSLHGTRLIFGNDGYLAADAGRIPKRSEAEMTANAHLIAAAPRLLDTLIQAVESTG